MYNKLILLTFFCIFTTSLCIAAKPAKHADKAIEEVLSRYNYVGLAIAVVKNNKIVYSNEFGVKNLATGKKIKKNDLFRIASISKTFTSTAIMQLYERGKFGLDDDVSEALGFKVRNPRFLNDKITYRMLLSHTSSLSDAQGYFDYDVLKPEINPDHAKAYWDYAPGGKYNYCNLGFNLLGALIEIHSGQRFDVYIRHNILFPLGIKEAGFNVDSLDAKKFVSLYSRENNEWIEAPEAYRSRKDDLLHYYIKGKNTVWFSPTGGMKISAVNLARWMMCVMNFGTLGKAHIIGEQTARLMLDPVKPANAYGLGMMKDDSYVPGEVFYGHTGGAYGLTSAMFFIPEKQFGVVMITNGSAPKSSGNKIIPDIIAAMYRVFMETNK